jgi:predicted dehydrogenase
METFSKMPEVRPAAVADVVQAAADNAAEALGVPAHYDPAELIERDDVHLVHIATPPSTHHRLVLDAAAAGKHSLCEKPLAMNLRQADEMLIAATDAHVIAPVNFVLRYNQVTEAVKAVIDSGAMGDVLSARLTNCAGDTPLGPDHWFWDKTVSGGIFVEHGVHFFDLYSHWLGPGEVIAAHTETRPATGQEDRVMCTIRHEGGAVVSHYHGFDQVSLMDRTDHRLVCELGDIRVEGWIPVSLTIDALVDDAAAKTLAACCPGCEVEVVETFDAERGDTTGRGKPRKVTRRVRLRHNPEPDKQTVYAASVGELLADQIAYIRDRTHARRITESNGRDALALAQAAVERAAST